MKALILAAGLGTRLRPLTDSMPKALVPVNGLPILHHLILNLKAKGFNHLVINLHHFSYLIKQYLQNFDFGVDIQISDESDLLLDTGGGIVKAAPLLFKDNNDPFLVHNVDILSNADLAQLIEYSSKTDMPVLLVSRRESSRKLLFDSEMRLKGWHDLKSDKYRPAGISDPTVLKELAFSGIYVMTKEATTEMERLLGRGKFPVMDYFLSPQRKSTIIGREDRKLKVLDIGKPDTLALASHFLI